MLPVIVGKKQNNNGVGRGGEMPQLEWHQIACGLFHTAGITPTGDLYSWGHGDYGQLGHGNNITIDRPKRVACLEGEKVTHVACGSYHTAVVTSEGHLYTWYA